MDINQLPLTHCNQNHVLGCAGKADRMRRAGMEWSEIFEALRPRDCCKIALQSIITMNYDAASYDINIIEGIESTDEDIESYDKEELVLDIMMSMESGKVGLDSPLIIDYLNMKEYDAQHIREFRDRHKLIPVREMTNEDKAALSNLAQIKDSEIEKVWAGLIRLKNREAKFRNMRLIRGIPKMESLAAKAPLRPFSVSVEPEVETASSSGPVDEPISRFEEVEVPVPEYKVPETQFDEITGAAIPLGEVVTGYVDVGDRKARSICTAKYIVPIFSRTIKGVQENRTRLN